MVKKLYTIHTPGSKAPGGVFIHILSPVWYTLHMKKQPKKSLASEKANKEAKMKRVRQVLAIDDSYAKRRKQQFYGTTERA